MCAALLDESPISISPTRRIVGQLQSPIAGPPLTIKSADTVTVSLRIDG
jgi:hypothetical protein